MSTTTKQQMQQLQVAQRQEIKARLGRVLGDDVPPISVGGVMFNGRTEVTLPMRSWFVLLDLAEAGYELQNAVEAMGELSSVSFGVPSGLRLVPEEED